MTTSAILADGVWAADPVLSVVDAPRRAPAASSLYVLVRIENAGVEPLRECGLVDEPEPDRACFAVAWRRDKRPPRLLFSRVEVAPVMARSAAVPPGETMERLVRLPTAARGQEQQFFLYLVVGRPGRLDWNEIPLRVHLDPAPAAVRRIIWTARALLLLYLTLTAWLLFVVLRRAAPKLA